MWSCKEPEESGISLLVIPHLVFKDQEEWAFSGPNPAPSFIPTTLPRLLLGCLQKADVLKVSKNVSLKRAKGGYNEGLAWWYVGSQ